MTEFESKCYGMSEADIREQYMESITAKFSGLEMVVMSIISDCQEASWSRDQEMLVCGDDREDIRKQLNVAKFILSEMMSAKESV